MRCEEVFFGTYRKPPVNVAFCPYRVCPMGAHSDHQYGKVTGFAIDKGVHIAYAPKQNGVIELASLNFEKRAQWYVNGVPDNQGDWADYLRGATKSLGSRYPLSRGIAGVIEGSLPIGGLSSSAAVIISFLAALCAVNHLRLSQSELIDVAQHAETDYVGVSVGKLDQSCEVLSRRNHLLYLDTKDDSYELIPTVPSMKPYEIAVFFSGVQRSLVGSKFNMRVDELKSAAYALKGYAIDDGREDELLVPYGRFSETRLRDVPRSVYDDYKNRLPSAWRRRAEHFYTEFARVEAGAEAWRRGDIETFGRLSTESGWSSIYNYETGSDELKALYEAIIRADGVYGGRFSGAGFKGCCMALIDPAYKERMREQVSEAYFRAFPGLADRFSVHFCRSADGVSTEGEGL
ncbi:MAG: galactokinase family protein [Clostridiales bacterium]|nr:galactokinase family protein [Clostridiales bacterium]